MRFDTHVCLVSGQPLPNLIPLLHPEVRPRRVALLVSADMKQRAELLAAIVAELGLEVESHPVSHTDAGAVRNAVEAILAARPDERVALNVTGGTKIMALAAYEAFRATGRSVFYVDTDSDVIRFLWEGHTLSMGNVVDTGLYLRAYGYSIIEVGGAVPDHWLAAARTMSARLDRWREAILALNALCHEAARNGLVARRPVEQSAGMRELLAHLERHGLMTVVTSRGKPYLRFPSQEALAFLNGPWLEAYVLDLVRTLDGVKEPLMGVKCLSRQGVQNELDVAFTYRNRLFIVECKTGRHNKGMPYKLDAVREKVGGLYGRVMYVSVEEMSQADATRAREWGMRVVQGAEIAALPDILRTWVSAGGRGEG